MIKSLVGLDASFGLANSEGRETNGLLMGYNYFDLVLLMMTSLNADVHIR